MPPGDQMGDSYHPYASSEQSIYSWHSYACSGGTTCFRSFDGTQKTHAYPF